MANEEINRLKLKPQTVLIDVEEFIFINRSELCSKQSNFVHIGEPWCQYVFTQSSLSL